MELEKLKKRLQTEVDTRSKELIELSHRMHSSPEIGYEEKRASQWLSDYLEKSGFKVERGVADLPTAFMASYGRGKPVLAFLAEYDALPGIGHGCGHNIIGTASVGASIASKLVADELGARIVVMGCPAEELLGGKVFMVDKGIFKGVDPALEMHPMAVKENWAGAKLTASILLEVEFFGKPAHAAFDPWNGINAQEAVIQSFTNINSLRAQLKDRSRVAGIILEGGKIHNVIPEHSTAKFMMRTARDCDLDELRNKVVKCLEAAAVSTGARLEYRWGPRCNAMQNNSVIIEEWRKNIAIFGREVGEININSGTTDTGNVSVVTPSIHVFLSISDTNLPGHSPPFAEATVSPAGDRAIIEGAKGLAMTAANFTAKPEVMTKAKKELEETRKRECISV